MELTFETKKEYKGLGKVKGKTNGGCMLITGRNGCGKTRLLSEIARIVRAKENERNELRRGRHRSAQPEETAEVVLSPVPDTCEFVGIGGGRSFISEGRVQEEHDIAQGMKERAGVHERHNDGNERRRMLLTTIAQENGTTYEELTTKQANDWLKEKYEGDRQWGASVTGLIAARQREIHLRIQERALEVAEENLPLGKDIQELMQYNEYKRINDILSKGGSLHVVKEVENREWQDLLRHNLYGTIPVNVVEVGTERPVMSMGDLSTGEQKLLWLAGCALKADRWDPEQSKVVLLLDEFDTGLHPSMKRRFISTVKSLIRKGIWIIATTHDPFTVGYADEDWVYVLESWWNGERRQSELEKANKEDAIRRMMGFTHESRPEATVSDAITDPKIMDALSRLVDTLVIPLER